ncbi:co-chaperone GroES [Paenibacillus validus]|uniref:Co-chaperonin GroES n=1 Tax=Paenibacillus validus TaxID=44253 RepID=A0A7X2ZGC5_9BACL|nr:MULTISPECIES: co-chaperone GroES [Paenibacillus]MED4603038.1 co-chaperone GroES [Paenibacillus validus]MED4609054.1 co-chaperone GroES [Paenibacillus validus]MUG73748.1 co-chaperone GroES [Paenibacillus validus]
MIKPLGDRVVIEAIAKEETTASGIVLPDTAKEKPQEGKVVAVGSGALKDGVRVPLELQEGDRVIFSKYAGTEIKFEGRELLIMRESDVLAIL